MPAASTRIPRRIIQTAKARASLSADDRRAVETFEALAPAYEHLFFDDASAEAFVARECPEYLALHRSLAGDIRQIDLFRYLAIHRLGGFYFDTDVHLESSLEPLLGEAAVFPFEKLTIFPWLQSAGMYWQLGNYAFAAEPGHPFLAAMITELVATVARCDRILPWWTPSSVHHAFRVYHATGPGLVSRVYLARPPLAAEVTVLLPPDATTWNRFGRFAVHACAGSWKRPTTPRGSRWLTRRNTRAKRRHGKLDPAALVAPQGARAMTWDLQCQLGAAQCMT